MFRYLMFFVVLISVMGCENELHPSVIRMQDDLGITLPWNFETDSYNETTNDSTLNQKASLSYEKGEIQSMARYIEKTPLYSLFVLELLPKLSKEDQIRLLNSLVKQYEIGYWLPGKNGYFFTCVQFPESILDYVDELPKNYDKRGMNYDVFASLDTVNHKLYYEYHGFQTPQKAAEEWSETIVEWEEEYQKWVNIFKKSP